MIKLRHTEVEKFSQGLVAMRVAEADTNQTVGFWFRLTLHHEALETASSKDPTMPSTPSPPKLVGSDFSFL